MKPPQIFIRGEMASNNFKGGVGCVEIGYSQRQAAKGYCDFKYLPVSALC